MIDPTHRNKLIVILGPTASGKSTVAISLARRHDAELICADSRTIYRQMDIGTAKSGQQPGSKVRAGQSLLASNPQLISGVVHHGLDLREPDEDFSVAEFQAIAGEAIDDILSRGKLPILVGGTGLYIKAVVDGLGIPVDSTDAHLRAKLEKRDLIDLVKQLELLDRAALAIVDLKNKRRVVRALEICLSTGQLFSEQRQTDPSQLDILQIGIELARPQLYERIDRRVDEMMAAGLLAEVEKLAESYSWQLSSMSGIGYKQLGMQLRGELSLDEAVELIKRDSRHYAKRQMTWFRRDERIIWLPVSEIEDHVSKWLEQ